MGISRALAYMIDPKMAKEADKRQAEYNAAMGIGHYGGGEGIISRFVNGWRANRYANQYYDDGRRIDQAHSPFPSNDLGHPPGCTCRFCFRGFINNGFG